MLLLFETAAGYALFKVLKEDKLKEVDVSDAAGPMAVRRPLSASPFIWALVTPQRSLGMCRICLMSSRRWIGRRRCVPAAAMLRTAAPSPAGSGSPAPPKRSQIVKLKAFSKFENTTEALAAATALVDSKLSKGGSDGQREGANTSDLLSETRTWPWHARCAYHRAHRCGPERPRHRAAIGASSE
jgi:hypothetical protein